MKEKLILQKKIIGKTPFFYGWVMVFMAGVAMFFTGPGQTFSFSIFMDQFINEFGWSRGQINNIYSLATLLSGSTMFMVGKMVDKHGTKKFMILSSILLTGAMVFLSMLTGSIIMLFIGFFLGRFSGQGVLGLSAGVLTPHWFIKKRGRALMLAGLGGTFGAAVFPKLNLFLIEAYGWRHAFQILGVIVFAICLPLVIVFIVNRPEDVGKYPDDADGEAEDKKEINDILMDEKTSLTQNETLKTGTFWLLFLGATQLSMIVTGIALNMLSIFRTGGLTDSFATTIMSFASLVGLGSNLVVGMFIDKVKKPHVVLAIMCFMQAVSYVILSGMDTKLEGVLYVIINGVSMAAFQLTHRMVLPKFFGRRYLGGVSGIMTIAWVGGSALGPIIFGNAFEIFGGYREILIIISLVPIISGVSLLFAKMPKKRQIG
ncbi:MAG: MFS transporter [Eubacteriales bacterium]